MSNTNPARGMRDFLPADIRKRNYVINIIKEVYESYGFEPLETPSVENLETLTGKYGEEGNQLMFKILKRGEKLDITDREITPVIRKSLEAFAKMSIYSKKIVGATIDAYEIGEIAKEEAKEISEFTGLFIEAVKAYREVILVDLALRYDLTVPLARVVANYKNDLPKFFKRYQIQPVWRADRPARGRYREFYQCDVDAIGSKSMVVEAELCTAVSEILQRLGFEDFTIRLNHRKVLTGILDSAGILAEKHTDALVALDKIDKIGSEGVEDELLSRGIQESVAQSLIKFVQETQREFVKKQDRFNWNIRVLVSLSDFVEENEFGKTGVNELWKLNELLKYTNAAQHLKIDPSLARGLSYYTGAIFEINVPDLTGSLGGGGRYDGLIGMFGKEQIPAVGFSLGLERILLIMDERGMFPEELQQNSADVMVTIWNEESIGESLKLANELRSQGLRVLVYPEADKLGKQFKYADSIKIPFVCVLGETELAENRVTLKNMQTGEQVSVAREEIAMNIMK